MAVDQLGDGARDPCLHLGERLAAGKPEPARVALDCAPLGELHERGGRGLGWDVGNLPWAIVPSDSLERVTSEIVDCFRCPRLVAWREQVAREKRASFAGEEYWGRPVPGFGDPRARLVIVGL